TESEKGAACGIVDWRSVSFVMVDSPQAKVHEDAVAAERFDRQREWSADLKIIHPLPLTGVVSLRQQEEQICLGIADTVTARGGDAPSVCLALARTITKITDRQAAAIMDGRERDVARVGDLELSGPDDHRRLREHLNLVRATALQISAWKQRPLSPEHSMTILVTHGQNIAIQASRTFRESPCLMVLRHEGTRVVTEAEWRKRGLTFPTKLSSFTIAAGKAVPTLLRGGEHAAPHDSLRLKERGNSGAINITQIACALLGVAPIPEELVMQGLRPDSELDKWKKGGPLPDALAAAIADRRNAIGEILSQATHNFLRSPANGDRSSP
ncbi:MAG: hypothetical protein RL518_302, partial [Pseudomonadota bacterium]